jgi:hypothetical protein
MCSFYIVLAGLAIQYSPIERALADDRDSVLETARGGAACDAVLPSLLKIIELHCALRFFNDRKQRD